MSETPAPVRAQTSADKSLAHFAEYQRLYGRTVAALEILFPGNSLDAQQFIVEFIALISHLQKRPS